MSLNGHVNIAEHGIIDREGTRRTSAVFEGYCYEAIEQDADNLESKGYPHSPVSGMLKDDVDYETDVSACNSISPVADFLTYAEYGDTFAYEQAADDVLENSSLPRYESFNSCVDINVDVSKSDAVDLDINSCRAIYQDDTECIEDTNNNMQDSLDTGYASVSRDSDSIEDEFGGAIDCIRGMDSSEMLDQADDKYHSSKTSNIHNDIDGLINNNIIDEYMCNNIIDQAYYTNSASGIDSVSDVDQVSDIDRTSDIDQTSDLEWDNEPITRTLILEFPLSANIATAFKTPKTTYDEYFFSMTENTQLQSCDQMYGSVKYRSNKGDILRRTNDDYHYRRRSRSLADIELSLDEKVTLLREEKTYVQRKIHEAIAEENIRNQHTKMFRLLPVDKRKQMIAKTLCDLKTRLEDQSARLQASYSTVLSLQNMFSKRRNDTVI